MEDWEPTPPPRPPSWPWWSAWFISGSSVIGVLVGVLVALWLVLPRWTGSLLIVGCWLLGAGIGWLTLALVCRVPRRDNPPERRARTKYEVRSTNDEVRARGDERRGGWQRAPLARPASAAG